MEVPKAIFHLLKSYLYLVPKETHSISHFYNNSCEILLSVALYRALLIIKIILPVITVYFIDCNRIQCIWNDPVIS